METITVRTSGRTEFVNITGDVQNAVKKSGVSDGVCIVYVPHTTAGLTVNENADPAVKADIISALERSVPWEAGYRHAEGNAAAHVKSSLMGFSHVFLVRGSSLVLGTWQGIFFTEFDGPRSRRVHVKVMKD